MLHRDRQTPASLKNAGPVNAFSVDVEDYYHVWALQRAYPRSLWPTLENRVVANTRRILDLCERHGVTGTFFILGCVAENDPDLVREVARRGHEIASHGYWHHKVHELSPAQFLADVRDTRNRLCDLTGEDVQGYRAPSFSITERTPWAYACLVEAGYRYSSSLHPIAHDHYGGVNAPRDPAPVPGMPILEIPLATVARFGRRISCAGGGHFRLLPYVWTAANLRHRRERESRASAFYIHPWEIDPGQPHAQGIPLKGRLRHYTGLARCEAKLDRLLRVLNWDRYDRVYGDQIASVTAAPAVDLEALA